MGSACTPRNFSSLSQFLFPKSCSEHSRAAAATSKGNSSQMFTFLTNHPTATCTLITKTQKMTWVGSCLLAWHQNTQLSLTRSLLHATTNHGKKNSTLERCRAWLSSHRLAQTKRTAWCPSQLGQDTGKVRKNFPSSTLSAISLHSSQLKHAPWAQGKGFHCVPAHKSHWGWEHEDKGKSTVVLKSVACLGVFAYPHIPVATWKSLDLCPPEVICPQSKREPFSTANTQQGKAKGLNVWKSEPQTLQFSLLRICSIQASTPPSHIQRSHLLFCPTAAKILPGVGPECETLEPASS